jgi:hypothetical protein
MFKDYPHITEPAREIPIIEEPDILVVGGGPAGVAAALSAGRCGLKVLVIERYNHLGGLWTGGLVLPLLSTHAVDSGGILKKVVFGIGDEIAERLRGMGMAVDEINPVVDPEAAKYVMDLMTREAGVKVLYHCWAANLLKENGIITAVVLETKSGRVAVRPKVVVDATGDGDVFAWADEDFVNLPYYIGLVHRLGNVDRIDTSAPGYKKLKAGAATPNPSVNWVNMHGEDEQDGINLFTLSDLTQRCRIRIWDDFEKLKATPGYESVFILDTASQIGVRVSRILRGKYQLKLEDSMKFKQFEDVIGICGAWRDIKYKGEIVPKAERPVWQIPLRSLIPLRTRNLIVAGRCFSFEEELSEDARIIGTALLTGHAAGAAAVVAFQGGGDVQNLEPQLVQSLLKEQNAYLG